MPEPKYVSFTVFSWIIGIVSLLILGLISYTYSLDQKINNSDAKYVELKVDISKIQTDVLWIREKLSEKK